MLFIVPNLNWIDDDVNALWDLFPWNLCLLAAMIEDVCDVVILDAYQENYSEIWVLQLQDRGDIIPSSVLTVKPGSLL